MGTDISLWPYCWQPSSPRRITYYGSLGSPHNQPDALLCYREIIPVIREKFPNVELWIVGSNPPRFIKDLENNKLVNVTNFIEHPQEALKNMALVLCPWSSTYGFRSCIVEVMSLGILVVATSDAVYGMGLELSEGIILVNKALEMAEFAVNWLSNNKELNRQSPLGRRQMERSFSYEPTYKRFTQQLYDILNIKGKLCS